MYHANFLLQAKNIVEPFSYEAYKKSKIREKIEEERTSIVKINKLPKVNREMAQRLLENEQTTASSTAVNKKRVSELILTNGYNYLLLIAFNFLLFWIKLLFD